MARLTRRPDRRRLSGAATVISFNHDGLELARVRKKNRWLPIWHFIFVIYLGLIIRLVTMAEAGPASYAYRMEELETGTVFEKVAARVMYMDPVSRNIAINIRRGLKKFGAI